MLTYTALLALIPLALASPVVKRDTNVQIHPNGDQSLCLQFVAGPNGAKTPAQVTNDSPLTIGSCSTPNVFQNFDISFGDQLGIKLTGSNLCIDGGVSPNTNNVPIKLYTCYPGLAQQHFYYTNDLHIAITGGTTCIDRREGLTVAQLYTCIGFNTNQLWTIGAAPPPPSSTVAPPPASSSSTSPSSTPTPPANGGTRLYLNGDQTKCLTVQPDQGTVAGAAIVVSTCQSGSSLIGTLQLFDLVRGQTTVKPHNYDTSFCVDFGSDANGSLVTLQKCNGGASQNLYWTGVGDDHIAYTGGKTCLDAQLGSANPSGPFPYLFRAQAWQCVGGSSQQRWTS